MTPPNDYNNEGWTQWSKYVINTIKETNEKLDKLDTKVDDLRLELAKQKERTSQRATWFGILGSAIPITIYIILQLLKGNS